MSDGRPGKEFHVVNHSVPRGDGLPKVTGAAVYVSDMVVDNMAWAKVLRSPYAHANIVSIDTREAEQHPGVIAVLTERDLKDLHPYYGHAVKDHPLLAIGKVRFIGEPVAAVIAEDELSAHEATEKIVVEYEELTPVLDVDSALQPGGVVIHDADYAGGAFRGFDDFGAGSKNICQGVHVEWGDTQAAMAQAAHIAEGEFYFPMVYAYAMEPYVAIAQFDTKGTLTVWSSAQHPFMVRHDVAEVFGMPLNKVRVTVPYIGGGYGSKSYTKIEPLTAACAWKSGRPVKLQLSVEEAFLTTRGDDARVRMRTATDAQGKIIAREATIHMDTGAYAENSPMVGRKAANRIVGPYRIDNVKIDCLVVYTNTVPASSYRGLGGAQITFPGESQIDELAEMNQMDPLEFRLKNLAQSGESIHPGLRPIDADIPGDIKLATATLKKYGPLKKGHERAVCCSASDAGAHPVTLAMVQVYGDGGVSVFSGSTEIGQGSHTVLAQIAAEEMGVPLERVFLIGSDTATTLFERSTGASRTTTLMGRAVMESCREAIAQCKEMALELFKCTPAQLVEERGGLRFGDQRLTWAEILDRYFQMEGCSIIGRAYLRRAGPFKMVPIFWEVGVTGLEIDLDEETGKIALEQLVTVGDVGLAIHPAMTESQDIGAATQGIGAGLFEELLYDGQQLMNGSMLEYRVPRFSDLARHIELKLVQNQDGVGPYGAKGGGEGSVNPIGPCLANALKRLTGVRIRRLPLTPERVWKALQEKKSGSGRTKRAKIMLPLRRFEIHQPDSVREASQMLAHYGEDAGFYAGGTELLLAMKHGALRYKHLIDLKTIPGSDAIVEKGGYIEIGALATHRSLERSGLLQQKLPVLAELEANVANVRVRAAGTLGGNLCFAEPHSDPAALLLALDAKLYVETMDLQREISMGEFIGGAYANNLMPNEILVKIAVPSAAPTHRAAYMKFQVHERPTLGLALWLDTPDGGSTFTAGRVALGCVCAFPARALEAEKLFVGTRSEVEARLPQAADALADAADLLDDHEGSVEYKRHLIGVFLRRTFRKALGELPREEVVVPR